MSDQHEPDRFGQPGPEQPPYGQQSDPTAPIPSSPAPSSPPHSPTSEQTFPTGGSVAVDRDPTSFLSALFDFTFTHFVTPKLVRIVYLLATVALAIAWLFWMVAGFAQSTALGFLFLVVGPVVLVIYLAVIRMTLEFYLSVVRMSEDIHKRLPHA